MGSYVGESVGKKFARLALWDLVARLSGERFTRGTHIVLASQNGGDISVLLALGVPPRNIVACDLIAERAHACRARWPSVTTIIADVRSVVEEYRSGAASCFLDFQGPIGPTTTPIARDVARQLKPSALLAIAVQRGRENDTDYGCGYAPLNRRDRRALRAAGAKPTSETDELAEGIELFDALSVHADAGRNVESLALRARRCIAPPNSGRAALVLEHAMFGFRGIDASMNRASIVEHELRREIVKVWAYKGNVVPMTITLTRAWDEAASRLVSWMYRRGRITPEVVSFDDTNLRLLAVEMHRRGVDAPGLLNLDPLTVIAWKAHETRGTYRRTG